MCVDCNKETLTGVVYYSGLDFTICGNITITNGEDMNIVLSKIEQCLDFIENDELLEVTPENLRIRKRELDPNKRKRAGKS